MQASGHRVSGATYLNQKPHAPPQQRRVLGMMLADSVDALRVMTQHLRRLLDYLSALAGASGCLSSVLDDQEDILYVSRPP